MKVNLCIEEDEQFRASVRSLIEGQVRHVLREELSGIVAGEIAKLRLLQPNPPALSDMVTGVISKHVDAQVTRLGIRTELQSAVKERVIQMVLEVDEDFRAAVLATINKKLAT